MAEVRDVIEDALRELGVLAAGEVGSNDDLTWGRTALNRLVDQWAAEKLMMYQRLRTVFAITSGTRDYSVGTGSTINRLRPVYVDEIRYQDTSTSNELPLDMLTDDAWASIVIKTTTAAHPTYWYYNPTYPTGTVSFYPTPTGSTLQGVMYAPLQVSEFTSLDTDLSLPSGYRRMIVKNLALEMSPSHTKPASRELIKQAIESKAVVKRANIRPSDLRIDASALVQGSGGRYYNINTGR